MTNGWISNLTATVREVFRVFFGIKKEDGGAETAEKAAKTAAKASSYWLTDYALTLLSPATVAFFKWFGWSDLPITLVMWVEDLIISYGFVLFSRNVVEDFTVTKALRSSVKVIWGKNKNVGIILSAILIIRFAIWDGPERIVIFFHEKLEGRRIREFAALLILSAIQALFWTKMYSLGIDGLAKIWHLIF